MALFKIFTDKSGTYRILLKLNNRIEFTSESFPCRIECIKAVNTIRRNSNYERAYEIDRLSCGSWFFKLKNTSNNKLLGQSESYINKFALYNKMALMMTKTEHAKFDSMTYSL